jgi:putative phage-type endonuclease
MAITKTRTSSREEWLEDRRKSLGGSDMGAVLGLNAYASPYTVWMDKTGKSPEKEQTEWMRLGNDLEDYVAQRFAEKSGLKVINDTATWRNSKYPHLHANIDRKIVGQRAGVECKVTSNQNEKKYRDGKFIDSYYAQCVDYLAVTEFDRWYLAVLIYGVGLRIYQMTRIPDDTKPEWCESSVYVDDAEIEALNTSANNFWHYVETNTPPPADGHPATSEALTTLYPESNRSMIDLIAFENDLNRYMTLGEQIKSLKASQDEVANKVKAFLGEAGKGEAINYKVSWSTQERTTFDKDRFMADHKDIDMSEYFKTSSSRVFRVNEIKH